jgi:hypothetical protein
VKLMADVVLSGLERSLGLGEVTKG